MVMWFRLLMLVCACVALLLTRPSTATQAVSTANPNNVFTATSTGLTANVSGALFSATSLQPGDTITKCISLKNTGAVAFNNIAISGNSDGLINNFVDVDIDAGSGSTDANCTGFVQSTGDLFTGDLDELPSNSDPLDDTRAISVNQTISYRIQLSVQNDIDQNTQGQNTNFWFRFEAGT